MNDKIIQLDPILKKVDDTIGKNGGYIPTISDNASILFNDIKDGSFEGQLKDYITEILNQLSQDISSLTKESNIVIEKDNYLNNDLDPRIKLLNERIEKHNALIAKRDALIDEKNKCIARLNYYKNLQKQNNKKKDENNE